MSAYGTKVVAVIEPRSEVGVKINSLFGDVQNLKNQMTTLLSDAPETLDTLNEIAAAISDDPAFFSTMSSANTTLQNNIDALSTAASTARTALQTLLQAAIDANKLTSDNAESLLSGRLDTLESDPTTATALTAVSGRVTTLEADPTTKTYVDNAVAGLVDGAGSALDTLNELSAALGDDANFATTVTNQIAAVQTDVDANEADRKTYFKWDSNLTKVVNPLRSSEIEIGNNIHIDPAAGYATQFDGNVEFDNNTVLSHGGTDLTATFAEINAFDGRLDTLEADPTTAAAVAAVQSDVDQNETDADAAIAAANVAMLAAVASVQSDVDQNESDADTAIALKANIASPTFTGTVGGITKSMVGLGNVDNTADTDKPVSTAQQAAIDAVQADVNQNESDADTALALKAPLASPAFTGDVNFDSGAMFFKQSSGRLGLGTTNPGDSVHVHGGLIVQRSGGSSKIYLKQNTTDDGMTIQGQSNSANSIVLDTVGGSAGVKFTNNDHGTLATIGSTISLNKDVTMKLTSSVTPAANSDMMIEATNNTTLTFKLKGSDGTVRSGTITLS
jgi:hypothetical protein